MLFARKMGATVDSAVSRFGEIPTPRSQSGHPGEVVLRLRKIAAILSIITHDFPMNSGYNRRYLLEVWQNGLGAARDAPPSVTSVDPRLSNH